MKCDFYCEGANDMFVAKAILVKLGLLPSDEDRLKLLGTKFERVEGKDELIVKLSTFVEAWTSGRNIAFVFDADLSFHSRFKQILKGINEGLGAMKGAMQPLNAEQEHELMQQGIVNLPFGNLGLWIWPNHADDGTLEDLLLSITNQQDQLWNEAQNVIGIIESNNSLLRYKPEKSHKKALINTWLAWQEKPGLPYGLNIARSKVFTEFANSKYIERFKVWSDKLK